MPKRVIASFLAFSVLITMVTTVFAVDYNLGVTVGQYVKYGNFVDIYEGPNLDWVKLEVVDVSGKVVTFRESGLFKNGTATSDCNYFLLLNNETLKVNIETGWCVDLEYPYTTMDFVIPGNLNEGDQIPPLDVDDIYKYFVNKTETRTYLGVSRQVNVAHLLLPPYYTPKVYDKITGFMLDWLSFSVIETNIFATPTAPDGELPTYDVYTYLAVAAAAIIVVAAIVVFLKKRHKKPS